MIPVYLGCADRVGEAPVRLVDRFPDATVVDAVPAAEGTTGIEWRFDETVASSTDTGWKAHSVEDLRIRGGRLAGRVLSDSAVIHAERTAPIDENDLLHAVEISINVSDGGQLSATFDGAEEPNIERAAAGVFPWPMQSPVVPGDAPQRYTLKPSRPLALSNARHLLIRPVDVEGATFELESIRIVSRREYLAGIESGVGWHGMDDVFRESIVTRASETVSFDVVLPERPWLDLALATIEEGAATFRIEARQEAGEPLVFERTVSQPHRWNGARLDLAPLAGRDVTLTLNLTADKNGFLGFWGTAAIRSAVAPTASTEQPQGVIVLLADTLRADHLDMLGYSRRTAPVLAKLAAEGALARDAISQATWTKVSVPAIFTSLYPTTHTVKSFADRLPASARTMAEQFREAGYATLALTSISFTGQFTNLHQGYEELHESASLKASENSKTAREYMDRLLPWLESHRDVPFFVFLHVADPHSPYEAYPPFDTRWGEPGDNERLREQIDKVRPHIENPILKMFGMPARWEIEKAGVDPDEIVKLELDAYDGSIHAMDIEVGRLMERLRELGLADRTLLAFVSDHGTEFLDHDRHFHGQTAYGELNRVPMLYWGPSFVPAGIELLPTVQTIDLMPTVLELAGLEEPVGIQGRSLLPLMQAALAGGQQSWPHPAITEKAAGLASPRMPNGGTEYISLIADGWKLIRHIPPTEGVGEYELFDHREDPLNKINLAADHPEKVRELAGLLGRWEEEALAARLKEGDHEQNMDPAELERLRSLGYIN